LEVLFAPSDRLGLAAGSGQAPDGGTIDAAALV
jgi:hypothetical protein